MTKRHSMTALFALVALTSAVSLNARAADVAEPSEAQTESDQDIPKVSAPANTGANASQDNFGRFVKKSKAEFDADAPLKAQFKNYGQYVSSLKHHDGEHGKGSDSHGGGNASGSHGGGGHSGSGANPGTIN